MRISRLQVANDVVKLRSTLALICEHIPAIVHVSDGRSTLAHANSVTGNGNQQVANELLYLGAGTVDFLRLASRLLLARPALLVVLSIVRELTELKAHQGPSEDGCRRVRDRFRSGLSVFAPTPKNGLNSSSAFSTAREVLTAKCMDS